MNVLLMFPELLVLVLAIGVLLVDLWTSPERKRLLGYGAAAGLAVVFLYTLALPDTESHYAFGQSYVRDGLALFFKRFFLIAGIFVLLISVDFWPRGQEAISEFYGLSLLALCGMMFAASANDFTVLFVSLELITVTFYVLTSFQRRRLPSLEAGLKYLIMGAMASGFTIYGIALIYGSSGTMSFPRLAELSVGLKEHPVFLVGTLLLILGLGFKIAAFPLQIWAPDVYQGAPPPVVAFLAVGSKAAGFVLLIRVLFTAIPVVTAHWNQLLVVISAVTILYGNLCAIPQRNLKRLLGYSSIAHAGYLLLGITAMAANVHNPAGGAAILFYLTGYLFTVLGAFAVVSLILSRLDVEDVTALAGLHRRSPLLAGTMTLAMVSLAGIPPLAGFFGKFLLLQAVLEQGGTNSAYYGLVVIAIVGVVISLYYYFGIIRVIFWSREPADLSPILIPWPTRVTLGACCLGMLYLGLFPGSVLKVAAHAVGGLKF